MRCLSEGVSEQVWGRLIRVVIALIPKVDETTERQFYVTGAVDRQDIRRVWLVGRLVW